jgi:hypothetical protein
MAPTEQVQLGKQPAAPTASQVPPVPPAPSPPPGPAYGPGPGQPPPGHGYGYGYGYGGGAAQGYPPPGPGWMPYTPTPPTSGICTASMVLGIIATIVTLTIWGSFLGIILGPIALGLAVSARRRISRGAAYGTGQATAGLVLGIIATALSAVFVALLIIGFTVYEDTKDRYGDDSYDYDARTAGAAPFAHRGLTAAQGQG